jgi:hypothetical protein
MPTTIMVTTGRLFIGNSFCGEVNGCNAGRLHGGASRPQADKGDRRFPDPAIGMRACLPI